jgi:hypothetical protein
VASETELAAFTEDTANARETAMGECLSDLTAKIITAISR